MAAVSGNAFAKGDVAAGHSRSAACVSCHGSIGVSPTDAWPTLAGQGYAYLVKQLQAYRDGTRKSPLMDQMAKTLTDSDIENLAAFYSTLTSPSTAALASRASAPAGEIAHAPIITSPDFVVPVAHTTAQYWADKLPAGEARTVIVQKCQLCHTLQRGIAFAQSREQWQRIVESMIARGSPVTPEEVPAVVDYFTRNFGPDSPAIPEVGMKPCKAGEWPKGSSDFRSRWQGAYNVWVSNQQGASIDVVDSATNKIVNRIKCISAPDRVEFSHDGNTAYAPDRFERNVTVIDTRTGAIKAKIPLIDRPNSAAISRDSKKLYVGIWPVSGDDNKRGYIQVIDTGTLKVAKTIQTKGGIHLPAISPDGKLLLALSSAGRFVDAYDTTTDELLYTCCTGSEVGSMHMEAGPDGSTSRIFYSQAFSGVVVADARTGKELRRIDHPVDTQGPSKGIRHQMPTFVGSGFHGGEISPDGKSFWAIQASWVYRYALPSLTAIGDVHLSLVDQSGRSFAQPLEGTALTISPDSRKIYAIRGGRNLLAVIDAETMKEEALIPTGEYGLHVSIWPGSAHKGIANEDQ